MELKKILFMKTIQTQIRIDAEVKEEVTKLFRSLGLDMSRAVNLFLHQCLLRGGLPFPVEIPNYNEETLAALEEARRLSRDPNAKAFQTMEELREAIDLPE